MMDKLTVDVLIIGSGPVGAAFARVLNDTVPGTKITMVDLGPKITEKAGKHVKNIIDAVEREKAQIASQGPNQYRYTVPTLQQRAEAAKSGQIAPAILARPGTHLVAESDNDIKASGMPAASFSSNVGGMGSHWTCACPRPGSSEIVPFIPAHQWDIFIRKAEQLLSVSADVYEESSEAIVIRDILGEIFDDHLPEGRKVQRMPLACRTSGDNTRYWTGPDVVLGDLAKIEDNRYFEIRSETICTSITHENGQATGAYIKHLPTGAVSLVEAKAIIVAADAIRTPQLLWASGIRPKALGHYLNDQPQIMCAVEINEALIEKHVAFSRSKSENKNGSGDPTLGVFWVPFDETTHPFHGQVMHMDLSPVQLDITSGPVKPNKVIGLGWFCRKELRYEDHIEFDDELTDYFGMPKTTIHYELTEKDLDEIKLAMKEQAKAAAAFGKTVKEGEQFMIPAGSSLHYQGSVRMGKENDGSSVCDSYSAVWGYKNLFVGGNGVIPTATACNPTLTSVALAVRACAKVTDILRN